MSGRAEAATIVIIGCPGYAGVQWLRRSEARSDIERPQLETARPVAERCPLLIAGYALSAGLLTGVVLSYAPRRPLR